jgi:hypothetical protein
MELSDLHHPSCKLNQSRQGSFEDDDEDDDDLEEDRKVDCLICEKRLIMEAVARLEEERWRSGGAFPAKGWGYSFFSWEDYKYCK